MRLFIDNTSLSLLLSFSVSLSFLLPLLSLSSLLPFLLHYVIICNSKVNILTNLLHCQSSLRNLIDCCVPVLSLLSHLFFHIYFTIHCRTHLPTGNLIHRPSLSVIWTIVQAIVLSSKQLSKPSGIPSVYADDTASNTSHFFWSNCIIASAV